MGYNNVFPNENNQANNAYHKSFHPICDGFFTLVAFCLLDPSREKASGPHFQINASKISCIISRECCTWYDGIHPSVTSNPASYPLFLQHILFAVESFHTTILENSHAIMVLFLRRLGIRHQPWHTNKRAYEPTLAMVKCRWGQVGDAKCRWSQVGVSTVSTVYQGRAESKLNLGASESDLSPSSIVAGPARVENGSRIRSGHTSRVQMLPCFDAPFCFGSMIKPATITSVDSIKTCLLPALCDQLIMRPLRRRQALGYRCAHCSSEFDSRTGMDCHRRHPTSLGTPCADPHNSKSLSFTARANVASSFLRQHDTLGTTGIPAHCTRTLHVYIVPLCVMMCDITCIIVITAIIAKISAIIGNKVSSFLWEDTNYTYYHRLFYALSQRFCMKNNRK